MRWLLIVIVMVITIMAIIVVVVVYWLLAECPAGMPPLRLCDIPTDSDIDEGAPLHFVPPLHACCGQLRGLASRIPSLVHPNPIELQPNTF